MTWGAPLLLLLGGLWLQPARAGSHSLRYFYSSHSGPLPGVPQFSYVGYVDDVPISSYTSESRRAGPLAPWMERITAEDPKYWEVQTEVSRSLEQVFKVDVRIMMDRVNQTQVAPQTMVTRRKNGGRTFLTGYAYGFYPRDIEVKWVRNGVEMPWESSEILPNPDGTYQAKKTVEVQEGDDEKMYRYEVYHSSLPDTVTVMYEEKSPPMGVIIGGVIGALVGVGLITAVVWFVYKKTSGKSDYAAAKRDPAPGDSSSSQASA